MMPVMPPHNHLATIGFFFSRVGQRADEADQHVDQRDAGLDQRADGPERVEDGPHQDRGEAAGDAPASALSHAMLPTAMPPPHCMKNTSEFMARATAVAEAFAQLKLLLRFVEHVSAARGTAPSSPYRRMDLTSRPIAVITPKPAMTIPTACMTSAMTIIVLPFLAAEAIMMASRR